MRWFTDPLAALHGHLFPWIPVFVGLGIGGYFSLHHDPDMAGLLPVAGILVGLAAGWQFGPAWLRPFALAAALVALGLLLAAGRAHLVSAPVLGFRYYGPVEGRVLLIDRSASDQMRLTLDRVILERTAPQRTPARVRITVGGDQPHIALEPGQRVMLTAFLSPPEGPSQPGGFDFQRMAWFLRLGAVGFSRSPVMALEPPQPGQVGLYFARARQRISDHVRQQFPDDPGGFVTAILTNDTSGLSTEALNSLRASSLAHVLSISGLHMSLLAAFVFAGLRSSIALVPVVALRVSSKKIAAAVALVAALFYFGLSGGAVATQRSFVMIAVMLAAVLVDRRAISLRSIAIAALIVLGLQPESLLQPGFQMSFAATVALVAAFAALRDRSEAGWRMPWWLRPVVALAMASVVAGAATAPYGAAAFNKLSGYGLLANMLAEPVMALVVMPGAVIAALLSLIGLSEPVLWVMVQGARWILAVSDFVAGLQGAVVGVVSPPVWALPVLTLGGLWLVLVPLRSRWIGVVPVLAALLAWPLAERPALLVSADGVIVGLMTGEGRAFSTLKGGKFIATNWLEDDGDLTPLKEAGRRAGFDLTDNGLAFDLAGKRGLLVAGETEPDRISALCQTADLLIIAARTDKMAAAKVASGPCLVIDPESLRLSGPLALTVQGGKVISKGVRETQGERVWSGKPAPPPRPAADSDLPTSVSLD